MRILSIFMVLFTLMGVVSCQTEPVDPLLLVDDSDNEPTPLPASFQVQFGDRTFVADSTVATLGDGEIVIKGYAGDFGENVTIKVPATTTGTYTVTNITYDPGVNPNFYSNINPANTPTGSVTIQSIDTVRRTVTGIFSFTGYYSLPAENLPSIAFTNGVFTNIAYTAPGVNPNPAGAFSVNIDGTPFIADEADAFLNSEGFSIGGYKDNGETVWIILDQNNITTGTYTNAVMAYSTEDSGNPSYNDANNTTGTFIITEIDTVNHTVSGSFSFTGDYSDTAAGLPAKVFTNGTFTDVSYLDEDPGDVGEFRATVDGTATTYEGDNLIFNTVTEGDNATTTIRAFTTSYRIDFFLNANASAGTYVFINSTNSTPRAVFTDTVTNITYNNITGGSLIITSNEDGIIAGTFNFDVKNDAGEVIHTVTNGAFEIEHE